MSLMLHDFLHKRVFLVLEKSCYAFRRLGGNTFEIEHQSVKDVAETGHGDPVSIGERNMRACDEEEDWQDGST